MVRTGPDLRGFSRWVNRVLAMMKTKHGWGITKVAEKGGISRSMLTNWRDGDWSQGKPTRPTVERFCERLKLKKDAPFSYLGFALDLREELADTELEEIAEDSELVRRIRLMELARDQPNIRPERRRELELTLMQLKGMLDVTWDDGLEDELRREA